MFSRISFLLITLFWLTMTYLLWRSEYVGQNQVGSVVPVELVWRKILTAPDNSSLQMLHKGVKVGYCRWASSIGQELATGKILADDTPPDGMVPRMTGYRLDLEGNVALENMTGRLGFDFDVRLATNNVWQDFSLLIKLQKARWEVHSHASEQTVRLLMDDRSDGTREERIFKFSELENPQALLQEFDVPAPLGLLGSLSPLPSATSGASLVPGLVWKARNDWVAMGHTSVRAYRLEAALFDRYRMLIIVSRVGEILRVELPDGWELINDQLYTL
jgi:hypothetical protein